MTEPRPPVDSAPTDPGGGTRPDRHVSIRMYGQGLGDCFLLTFPRVSGTGEADGTRPVHVLIDCGVIAGTPGDRERMQAIVRDIADTTGGRLDLLVLTHEHWDHLSGFLKAEAEWSAIDVETLWMAWTELPDTEGLPGVLKRILDKQRRTLTRIADDALRFGLERRQSVAIELMGFLADEAVDGVSFAAAPTVADALDAAKAKVPDESRRAYCEPGEVRPIPGTDARCYVLGPPRSDARLRQTDPSADRETYASDDGHGVVGNRRRGMAELDATSSLRAMGENRSSFNALAMPILGPSLLAAGSSDADDVHVDVDRESYERSFPFDRSWRIAIPEAERAAAEHPDAYPGLAAYIQDVLHWRRIDFDWLASATEFALQADHLTNNTSLVLAIELPSEDGGKGKVLLFVADAQVGNWLSWDDIAEWIPREGAVPSQRSPDIADMLGRVAFYKVGHHGSHNATLAARGVERMPEDTPFVAFVPVSVPVARRIKRWEEMPLDELLDALSRRSGGGVVLPDGTVWPDRDSEAGRDAIGVTVSDRMLEPKVRKGEQIEDAVPLWVEVAISY